MKLNQKKFVFQMDFSSSRDEYPPDGYSLLSQNVETAADENEDENEDEDEEFRRFAALRVFESTEVKKTTTTTITTTESIWKRSVESESFPVDDEKAETIKKLMLNIQLPMTNIPQWVEKCPEDQWKKKLDEQISCRQTTFFSNENKEKN